MLPLATNVARFHFETADLAPEVFEVAHFKGTEGISQLYHFEIDLFSQDPAIDFSSVVAKPATFFMTRGMTRVPIHGQVADFIQLGQTRNHTAYRVVLVPTLWRLTHKFRSKIFQRLTVEEIITEVLSDIFDFRFDLTGEYDPREYCVQYNETDYNFICRLMEKEGIFFYFEQGNESETLIITDDPNSLQIIDGPNHLLYDTGDGMETQGVELVQEFICRERAGWPEQVTLKDYHYETPNESLFPDESLSESPEAGFGFHYEYGKDHLKTPAQGEQRVARRKEALVLSRRVFQGGSNCVDMRSGYQFSLMGHYRPDFNADYLLVEVKHEGSQRDAMGHDTNGEDQEEGLLYRNTFSCLPAETPYRPSKKTPVPKVPGVLVAHVDHPSRSSEDHGHTSDYAHLDDQGRYKATLNFDEFRDHPAADHSLPIPATQNYAGPDYGTHFPLHGGVEVLLSCVNGDPDRPFIVGTVPNPNHTSPVTSENNTQNIIRTFARNEMLMEDHEGITKISLTSAGGHNETLDDGQQRIILTSSGGHRVEMSDKDTFIEAMTTGEHFLRMDDPDQLITLRTTGGQILQMQDGEEDRRIRLQSTTGHFLDLSDDEYKCGFVSAEANIIAMHDSGSDHPQGIHVHTIDGHALYMNDAEQHIKLLSVDKHGLGISDEETTVMLVLDEGDGHVVELTDGDLGNYIKLETPSDQHVILDEDMGIEIESPDQEVVIKAGTSIRLEVGSNSIVIDSTGVSINGTLVKIN